MTQMPGARTGAGPLERSEDFLDQVVADAEAGAGFDGAGEAGIEDVRDEIVVRYRLDGGLLGRGLIGGLAAVILLGVGEGGVELLQEVCDLLLFGLEGEGEFAQVEGPFAGLHVATLGGGLHLGPQGLKGLGGLLGLLLELVVGLLDRLDVHDGSSFKDTGVLIPPGNESLHPFQQ
ncbi:hypothetical protein GLS_c19750 [Gluconobacter oxydans DSM 3504]|uniref:Uncharacterized protein n=1 Tax=Gluconobacter oxydans DSM 3504 TaxID=1288313 RepID=A0A067Z5Z4_GLUOY|nr:hypothetical protein GLS_c19750 [Gluconobacter oxydans DSM 3504]